MKKRSKLFILAIGACSLLAGCGDSGSPSDAPKASDTPLTPSFSAYSCQEVTDDAVATELEAAKANIKDILKELDRGHLKDAQTVSASTKNSFKAVLDKYPANCEAQLGYALSIITDLMNNTKIKSFIDTITNKVDLADMGVEDYNRLMIAGDGKHLTSMAQDAMAQAIPSVDSAIIFMKNIVGDDNFVCHYTLDEKTYELDRGEFAPALAAMFVAKALLTFGASLNLDISANGKYDWMTDVDFHDGDTKTFADQLASLMNKGSSFTTVYDNWKPHYKNIPNLLDSAIHYVQIGLQYGIEESKTGMATQKNDPYIVGDDEMSDVSAADFQKAIDSLEHYRQALHTGVTITLPAGSQITVNLAKFFEITDGWQDYLPYHKLNDFSQWYTPVEGFFWSTNMESYYVEHEIEEALRPQIEKIPSYKRFYGWIDADRWNYTDNTYSTQYCADIKIDKEYSYKCFDLAVSGCTVTFTPSRNYGDDNVVLTAPSPVQLSSAVCKVQDGVTLFALPYKENVKNIFDFTDASGKKTISLQGLLNGKADESKIAEARSNNKRWIRADDYTLDDMKKLIYFPDVTFGGVLPGMTADKFWEVLKTEARSDDYDW